MSTAILTATNLVKSYMDGNEKVFAVRNLSLELYSGDFACILGRSGSGKSTLLNLLSLLDRPDSGKIMYKKKELSRISEKEINGLRRNDFATIFQFHHLLNYFTAEENVLLPYMHSLRPVRSEHKKAALAALDRVGLRDKSGRLPGQLSGGEQQRVAIARALVGSPSILFADEPTGSLDRETGDDVVSLLKELNQNGLTILMVTHQPDYAEKANRRFVMENGIFKQQS